MQKTNRIKILVMVFLLFVVTVKVNAQEEAVLFNQNIVDEGIQMSLQGLGKKNFIFMKVFIAGFYLDNSVALDDAMGDVAKRVEVAYFYPIAGEKLSDYTYDKMKENLSAGEMANLEKEIEAMRGYFPNLRPGDRYALTYIPGTGTKFVYNGRLLGTIDDSIFAKGIFSVWIGDNPMDSKIRDQILGMNSLDAKSEDDIKIVYSPVQILP